MKQFSLFVSILFVHQLSAYAFTESECDWFIEYDTQYITPAHFADFGLTYLKSSDSSSVGPNLKSHDSGRTASYRADKTNGKYFTTEDTCKSVAKAFYDANNGTLNVSYSYTYRKDATFNAKK